MTATENPSIAKSKLNTVCPQCGDNNSQPCLAVYNAGTANIATASVITTGVQQTKLAAQCAPPPLRGLGKAWDGVIGSYIVLCFLTGGLLLIAFPIFVIVMIGMGVAESKHRAFNRIEWPKLNAAWERMWVCQKCHHQFDPGNIPCQN